MLKNKFEIPIDWFVDPITKEPLEKKDDYLFSRIGSYRKDTIHNFWNFIPEKFEDLNKPEWKIWEELQGNGIIAYKNDPTHNLGVGYREDSLQFSKFCSFNGKVLDVGVGPQKIPTHIKYCKNKDVVFIGIDPIVGEQPREFPFVQCLGEYLPFKERLFDQVIFVTTIDHFIDPSIPLIEAKRVLKESGFIYIWLGEKGRNAPAPRVKHDWYEKLYTPNGADDPFHYKRYSSVLLEKCFNNLDLYIKSKEEIRIDEWRKNIFYKISVFH